MGVTKGCIISQAFELLNTNLLGPTWDSSLHRWRLCQNNPFHTHHTERKSYQRLLGDTWDRSPFPHPRRRRDYLREILARCGLLVSARHVTTATRCCPPGPVPTSTSCGTLPKSTRTISRRGLSLQAEVLTSQFHRTSQILPMFCVCASKIPGQTLCYL